MRSRTRIATVAAIAGASLLGATSPALASDFQLTVSGPATTTVGQPTVVHIDGTNPPPSVYPFPTWLDVSVIPVAATPTCPQDESQAIQLAPATGGGNIALADPEHVDVNGHFSAVAGFTPIGPGTVLICAYSEDDADNTFAIASLTLVINPAPPAGGPPKQTPPPRTGTPPPVAAPTNVVRPKVTRSGAVARCSQGRWSGAVSRYAYRWFVGGHIRAHASSNRLALSRSLHGRVLKCAVTATGPSGRSTTATSAGVRG